jgi:outer membrane protein TolC
VLDLPGARRLALHRQPALAAYWASLAAPLAKARALDNLCVPTVLRPDLRVRRQQVCLGITVSQALVCQGEWEAVHAVTRAYLAYLYAREQLRLADRAQDQFEQVKQFKKDLETRNGWIPVLPREPFDTQDRHAIDQVIALESALRAQRLQAEEGVRRALGALREAVGAAGECHLLAAGEDLPEPQMVPPCDLLVKLALQRRGEAVRAWQGAEIIALEADAQDARHGLKAETFAAASDIHAQPVPQVSDSAAYAPLVVGVEMPTLLVGKRADRVAQARALACRARAVVEKVRQLIVLQVEDAHARCVYTAGRVQELDTALAEARDHLAALREERRKSPLVRDRTPLTQILMAAVAASQIESQRNLALYEHNLALAGLERVTAGGFCPAFLPPPPDPNGTSAGGPRNGGTP